MGKRELSHLDQTISLFLPVFLPLLLSDGASKMIPLKFNIHIISIYNILHLFYLPYTLLQESFFFLAQLLCCPYYHFAVLYFRSCTTVVMFVLFHNH